MCLLPSTAPHCFPGSWFFSSPEPNTTSSGLEITDASVQGQTPNMAVEETRLGLRPPEWYWHPREGRALLPDAQINSSKPSHVVIQNAGHFPPPFPLLFLLLSLRLSTPLPSHRKASLEVGGIEALPSPDPFIGLRCPVWEG